MTVSVLNLAGRPIATLSPTAKPAGLQRMLWSGLASTGLAAPAGRYLLRITARTEDGAEANALASLSLRR